MNGIKSKVFLDTGARVTLIYKAWLNERKVSKEDEILDPHDKALSPVGKSSRKTVCRLGGHHFRTYRSWR